MKRAHRAWHRAMIAALLLCLCLACGGRGEQSPADEMPATDWPDDSGGGGRGGDDEGTTPEPDWNGVYDGLAPRGGVIGGMLGVSSHMPGGGPNFWREFELDRLEEAGVLRVRRDFEWARIEPEDDAWDFGQPDAYADAARERGFDFIALLVYGVPWAMPGGSHSEIDPADYADFAGHVAARYCDAIRRYEVWNEENLGGRFWLPEADPAHYGRLLAAAHEAIRDACPGAQVIFGGLAPWFDGGLGNGLYDFLDQVAAHHPDLCDHFDALAIHPYTIAQQTRPEAEIVLSGVGYPDMVGHVELAREKLAVLGCPDRPILWTEYGWPDLLIGEANQARYLVRGLLLGAMVGIEGAYWYTFWDGDGTNPLPTEDSFGLFAYSGEPTPGAQRAKPSYQAYAVLADLLNDARYAGDLSRRLVLPADVFALAFLADDGGRLIAALWDGRDAPSGVRVTLPFPPGTTALRVVEQDGTAWPGPFSDPLELTLSADVRYVEFALDGAP